MRSWMIAFLVGTITFWLLPELAFSAKYHIPIYILMVVLIVGLAVIVYLIKVGKVTYAKSHCPKKKHLTLLLFIIGLLYPYLQYNLSRSQINLIPEYQQNILVSGYVKSVKHESDRFLSLTLSLYSLADHSIGSIWRPQIKLNWYSPTREPEPGEKWQFNVRLKPIHGTANPFSFDYERWAWSNHIIASGYILDSSRGHKLKTSNSLLVSFIHSWHKQIKTTLDKDPSLDSNGVLQAFLLGNKQQLSEELYTSFRHSGLAHLLAISGLHIGMIAFFSLFLVEILWKRSNRLCLWLPAQSAGLISGLIAAFLYMELSGASIPTVRAFTMLSIFTLLKWNRINWGLLQIILATGCALVVIDPVIIISVSAWLSFGAVSMIALLLRWQQRGSVLSRIITWSKLNLGIWLGMIPFSLLLFGGVAGFGFMANLIAIPIMTFWVMPTLLVGSIASLFSTDLALLLWKGTEQGVDIIISLSHVLEKGFLQVPLLFPEYYLLAFLIFLLLLSSAFSLRNLSLIIVTIVLVDVIIFPKQGAGIQGARLIAFDVGQGLAVLWEYPDDGGRTHRLMYDTAGSKDDFIMGNNSWLPYFQKQNIASVDTVIVSHKDNDHSGGLTLLSNEIAVGKIYTSFAVSSLPVSQCRSRLNVLSGSRLKIQFLSPDSQLYRYRSLSTNNLSCVTEVHWYQSTVLLPGDIETFIENRLLQQKKLSPVDVLIAPHHGSLTSSSTKFVETLKPRVVIFSTGYKNRFQFPRQAVIDRYKSTHSLQFNTALDGAIICQWDKAGNFKHCKASRENYWGKWHWKASETEQATP